MPTQPPPPQKRKPIAGYLRPGQARGLDIQPPIRSNEKPLVIGPTTDFTFEVESPSRIVVHNHSERIVAFVLAIIPAVLANATALPWGRLFTELQQPGGPERILKGFLGGLGLNLLDRPKE